MPISFVGPSYALANRKASVQRAVNLYLIGMETQSKAEYIMQAVPGLTLFAALGSQIRGVYEATGRVFVVAGATLYELTSAGAATALGTLSTSTGTVDFAWGTTQLVIVDGPNGYALNLSTNVLTQITAAGWLGSKRVAYLDGYFIFTSPVTQTFYISAIDDATKLNALDFASAQSSPDQIVSHVIEHRQVWFFGEQTTEVWFDQGGVDFPLARNNGAAIEVGCIATFSSQKIDNGVIWIGRDRSGSGMVYRTNGYMPQRISTIAVEEALQASSDLTAAVAYVYQQDGQTFYCINAPGLASTWCYEVSTGAWHERCDVSAGNLISHRATCHAFGFNKHLVGDAAGNVYYMDKTRNTFNGDRRKCMRISPNDVNPARDRIPYHEFVLDCSSGLAASGISPVAELSWSNDGGFTYSNPVQKSIGQIGQFFARVIWQRLGMGRDRVWKLEYSDDAPFSIIQGIVR